MEIHKYDTSHKKLYTCCT